MSHGRIVSCVLAALTFPPVAAADVRLPHMFSSGVVLQRETRVQIFGFAAPGESVRVTASFGATSDVALTDQDGRWSTLLETRAAGGPYTLEVRGQNVVRVEDVYVGEVWLAAGQSNMEMPVGPVERSWAGVVDWQQEIAQAPDPRLRLFTVENAIAPVVRDDVNGAWAAATPDQVARFSATAYFFARRLRLELDVPVGIVASDWGGTPIEAWTSGITLGRSSEFVDTVQRLERDARSPDRARAADARSTQAWIASVEEVDHGLRDGFARLEFDDSAWDEVVQPGELGGDHARHDGLFWLRRSFETPAALVGREATLALPPIDDFDAVFFDGVLVGSTLLRAKSRSARVYTIPSDLMTRGRHVVAVRVFDVAGTAGILGEPVGLHVFAGDVDVPLAGAWRARRGAPSSVVPTRPADADFGPHTPSSLYNAMIAPLTRFTFRGAIWYQGESNRKRAAQYESLFVGMIEDWRARFSNATWPFYFVQIAPFDYAGDTGEAAELREAQRRALRLAATGMVSTIDLGEAQDIHPRNKRPVGERLASIALAKTYGRDVELSGPLVDDRKSGPNQERGTFELYFDHALDLRFSGASDEVFEIQDARSGWVAAAAEIVENRVILSSESCASPTAARLDARAGARSRLVNSSGLPAAAFRIGAGKWITDRGSAVGRWTKNGDTLTIAPRARSAVEGLPIGNGLLGAFVWIDGSDLKLTLGKSDWWDARRPEITRADDWNVRDLRALVAAGDTGRIQERYDEPYERFAYPGRLALGELVIPLGERKPRTYGLDLVRGEAQIPLSNGFVHAIASAARPIFALRLEDADLAQFSPNDWRLTLAGGEAASFEDGVRGEIVGASGHSVGIAVRAANVEGGLEIVIAVVDGAEDALPTELAAERAQQALGIGYSRLFGEHILSFRSATGSSHVSIGDKALQNHYDFVRFLTVSGSRRGSPPASLQGPWNVDLAAPPWHGDYHCDLNLQATYGAYAPAGLFDSGLALFEHHARLLPSFREFARTFFGVGGAVVPGVMALDGTPLGGWAQYALSPTNGAWTAFLHARHWRVTQDEHFLREFAAPFCREIATALDELAPLCADGSRRLALSSSPEFRDNSAGAWLTPNSNYDTALLHAAFASAAEMERARGDDSAAQHFERARAELPAFDLDASGALTIASGAPYDESHRHLSHTLAIHPLGILSIEGEAADRRTVDATIDGILAAGTKEWTGYTFAWFASLAARAGRPEIARRALLDYERAFTLSNGLHVNGDRSGEGLSNFTYQPFTLEGNMLAMEAVHEMLLQSWGGIVRVFPAASVLWPEAAFDELHAEGGFVVSARRADGVTRSVTVRAVSAGRLRLRDPFAGREPRWSRVGVERVGTDFVVDLARDEVLVGSADPTR
ncbi:MAG: sialate O-acetylesterase [Planctomycetota bacterium]|nr:sialate O-acetylesterase [Planctomycetota bacterium]